MFMMMMMMMTRVLMNFFCSRSNDDINAQYLVSCNKCKYEKWDFWKMS